MAVDYLSTLNSKGSGLNITQIVDSLVDAEKIPQKDIIEVITNFEKQKIK